jgi:hypothetical protein
MNLSKSGPSFRVGARGAGVTFGHGQIRRTVGLPGTGMYWTSVTRSGRQQTRRVASRPIRRAPPPAARPQPTAQQNRQTLIGCLWVVGVIVGISLAVVTYGIALIPIGLGIWWWIHHRHQQPQYLAGKLFKKAAAAPLPDAVHLYHQAIDADQTGVATLRTAGDWFYQHACWSDAADAYAGYLHLEKNAEVEHNYAASLLASGHPDEAISEFQGLAAGYDRIPGQLISELAGAFLLKGDAGQALAIAKEAPLQQHQLDDGLQKALLARAFAEYMVGQKAKAISDLERLYAVNPNFPQISNIKQRMSDGTFQIEAPITRPAWYPAEVELREGPAVEEVQDGHPEEMAAGTLSPDGVWSWTGTQWVPANNPPADGTALVEGLGQSVSVPPDHSAPSTSGLPAATPIAVGPEVARDVTTSVPQSEPESENALPQFSSDGEWWWNGKEWIPSVSDDGRSRWNGTRWIPLDGST